MSLVRMAYYCAVIGGWSAFFAWILCEYLFLSRGGDGTWQVVCAAAIVGAAIGAGLNAVAGMSNGSVVQTVLRLGPGLVGGGIGGAVGGLLGNVLFVYLGMPRFIGWIIMGLGIGVVEGLYERSSSKIRNGLIGGGLGGLAGGVLFDILPGLLRSGSGMSSRAVGFVILGLCIGALIGLVQVALRDAWLTVLDGYRPGRQLILSSPVTILGRGDHLRLPFVGGPNTDLEPEHLAIERRSNGTFYVKDLKSRLGSFVNNVPVRGELDLRDGDTIKLGVNLVRFNLRQRRGAAQAAPAQPVIPVVPPPPPPPIRSLPKPPAPASSTASSTTAPPISQNPAAPPKPVQSSSAPPISAPPAAPKPGGTKLPPPPPKKSS